MTGEDDIPRFYGAITPSTCYHISGLCPKLKYRAINKHFDATVYTLESDAIMAGHKKRCPVCFGMYRFRIKIGDREFEHLLYKKELDVLMILDSALSKGELISVTSICFMSNYPHGVTHNALARLRRSKLIASTAINSDAEKRGNRRITMAGQGVIAAYRAGIFSNPILQAVDMPINNRLV